jgi:SEC-C motif
MHDRLGGRVAYPKRGIRRTPGGSAWRTPNFRGKSRVLSWKLGAGVRAGCVLRLGPMDTVRLGRNDPCWCGSGKKFKKCHLDSDRENAKRAEAPPHHPRKTKERRVVLQRPAGTFGDRIPARRQAQELEWAREWLRGNHGRVETHPVCRLGESGPDWGVTPGPGDEVAYFMNPHRFDDCLRPAIAWVTQTAIEEVPDLDLDRRLRHEDPREVNRTSWERIERWAAERGFALGHSDDVPLPRERWIGVVVVDRALLRRQEGEITFDDHALCMSFDRLVYDPMASCRPPPGMRMADYGPANITYGLSFETQEE